MSVSEKMKKGVFILIILFFVSIACVSASDDLNATDSLSISDGDDIVSSSDFNQLQNLINSAGEGDTISLTSDYVGGGEVNINKQITINGNGHSIDASHASRIFMINADNVVLKNLRLLNGNTDMWGGAIYCEHPLTIDNCEFISNHAKYKGGALYSFTELTVTNTIFSKNSAENGGAVYLESSHALFKNVKFLENQADWSSGALLSLYESNTTVEGCIFINNYATQYSDAVCGNNYLNIINSNFVSDRNNLEFIYYFDDWDGRDGNLYLMNNEMTSSYPWDIYYRGDTPISSPIYLKFENHTVKSGDMIKVGNIYDDMGNAIQVDLSNPVTLEVYDKNNKIVDKTNPEFNKDSGYTYTANLKDGIYRISGSISKDISSDSTVVDGILKVGNTDDKFNAKVTTASKKNKSGVILTSTVEPASATGTITFNVNDKNYTSTVKNGKASVTLTDLENGTYTVKTFYSGDNIFNAATAVDITFIVGPSDIFISADNLTKYFGGPERFSVSLTDKNGTPISGLNVVISINNQPYERITNSNGQASIAVNLNSGVYDVFVEYDGEEISSTVTVKSTVSGKDITKIYKNQTQYYATFVDTKGNLLKNTEVEFNINGVYYKRTTDSNGVAKMNINLNPETYIITAKNPNSGEQYTNRVTVLANMDQNNDLTKYYKNDSQYTIRLLDDEGNPVGANETVVFNINGVFYTRYTNASGVAKLNINLAPGDYILTAEYKGLKTSNKIKVLSILSAEDLKMSYRDGSKFVATLLDGQGHVFASQNITFNINGVFYTRMTDGNGVARLNINLMSGEYIITSSYDGLNIANKVTIS